MYHGTYKKSIADEGKCHVNCILGHARLQAERIEVYGGSVRYVHVIRESLDYAVDLQNKMLLSSSISTRQCDYQRHHTYSGNQGKYNHCSYDQEHYLSAGSKPKV